MIQCHTVSYYAVQLAQWFGNMQQQQPEILGASVKVTNLGSLCAFGLRYVDSQQDSIHEQTLTAELQKILNSVTSILKDPNDAEFRTCTTIELGFSQFPGLYEIQMQVEVFGYDLDALIPTRTYTNSYREKVPFCEWRHPVENNT